MRLIKKTTIQNNLSRNIFGNAGYYLPAFFIPVIIMTIVYAELKAAPFGNLSVLVGDLNSQYVDYFSSLRDLMTGEAQGNLFYNWSAGGGLNYFGLFTYYLISPFNLLLLLFSKQKITIAILLIILLKIGFSGVAFSYYVRKTFGFSRIITAAASSAYALSAFSVTYACNVMWLDAIILLPLMILGLDRLINEGKIALYASTLFLLFVTNYYMSFMAGIFAFIYFVAQSLVKWKASKNFLKNTLLFAVTSALTIGAAAIILLPSFFSLMDSYTGTVTSSLYSGKIACNLIDVISKLFIRCYDDITYGLPNICFGIAPLLLVPLYFLNKKIGKGEKTASAVVLLIFFISFTLKDVDNIWHMMRTPTWFPCRYSFVFIFFCLMLAMRCLKNRDGIKLQGVAVSGIILAVVLVLASYPKTENLNYSDIIYNSVFIAVYTVLIALVINNPPKIKTVSVCFSLLFVTVMIGEFYINTGSVISDLNNQLKYKTEDSYAGFYEKYSEAADYIKQSDTSAFYRVEHTDIRDANDNLSLSVKGVSHSSSVANQRVNLVYDSMGVDGGFANRFLKYTGSTCWFNSFFGIKYLMCQDEYIDFGFEKINEINGIGIYENQYALPAVFAVDAKKSKLPEINNETDSFSRMNSWLGALTGKGANCFQICGSFITSNGETKSAGGTDKVKQSAEYSVVADKDGYYYFSFNSDLPSFCTAKVNGVSIPGGNRVKGDALLTAGYFSAGDEIKISITKPNSDEYSDLSGICFARLNEEVYSTAFDSLKDNAMQLNDEPTSHFDGTVSLENDGYIMTSIPYDKGWSVYIDGEKTETIAVDDGLLAVSAAAGTHDVKFSFTPRGFTAGAAASIVFIAVLVLFCIFVRKKPELFAPSEIAGSQSNIDENACSENKNEEISKEPQPQTKTLRRKNNLFHIK